MYSQKVKTCHPEPFGIVTLSNAKGLAPQCRLREGSLIVSKKGRFFAESILRKVEILRFTQDDGSKDSE